MSQNRQTHFKNLIQLGKTALKKKKKYRKFYNQSGDASIYFTKNRSNCSKVFFRADLEILKSY